MIEKTNDLTQVIPPKELDATQLDTVFQYFMRRLASHRNSTTRYAENEAALSSSSGSTRQKERFLEAIDHWAQELLKNAWAACRCPMSDECPTLDPLSDTSTVGLPPLPPQEQVSRLLQTILFLHLTTSTQYHAHTRTFLFSLASVNEDTIAETLKHPESAIEEAERKTRTARDDQASQSLVLRRVGIGLGAVAGGVLIGVTGGLAAPLVGAGVTSVLGWLGVGGTAAGILASGLASSSIVCGALFGAYGSKKSAELVGRFTKEVEDLAILPVHTPSDTLAVRLCVSGWLESPDDVVAPWTIFGGADTFALQWEVDALMTLSNALLALMKSQAIKYVRAEIIKRTVLASLFAALSPTAWLKIGQIIDNPWIHARTLAVKTGKVLGILIEQRVLGNRPVTLVGYSLGSLVVFEALQHLASLPPEKTAHLIQDVYLFGSPISTDPRTWSAARRVVSGRLVNGYGKDDYILAVLSRVSNASWNVAGLTAVEVQGVENIACEGVEGHLKWRGMIGKVLEECKAPGLVNSEVEQQVENRAKKIEQIMDLSPDDVEDVLQKGPDAGS
ncbi:hypothetical protein QCA50_003114 [Cerrena zonata]|uniref:DUF726-domain-containing protein n=1 Tax=Cerrena zonata TaxID=2478898 RepID=A0AAW0GR71_9APHY